MQVVFPCISGSFCIYMIIAVKMLSNTIGATAIQTVEIKQLQETMFTYAKAHPDHIHAWHDGYRVILTEPK